VSSLTEFAKDVHLDSARVTGVGALSDACLQYFCAKTKRYVEIPAPAPIEVAAVVGDVELSPHGTAAAHLHAFLGAGDGAAMAGHLSRAHAGARLELIVTESPAYLRRTFDAESAVQSPLAA
jgi:uncharacterized protein